MPNGLIVAHGSPSDPEPQEAALAALASEVAARLPGWQVRGATLAADGALEAAVDGFDLPYLLPFFMAEGWFTRRELPRRLTILGASTIRLPSFGLAPELPALCARAAMEGAQAAGLDPRSTTLLLAAHGSQVARASAEGAQAMASILGRLAPFARVRAAFVEEPPFLEETARGLYPAICLPFFALRASHVAEDIPQALASAGFRGPLLPAIGEHSAVPALLAATFRRAAPSGSMKFS